MPSTLVSRNIVVRGHRTSVRLEQSMWDAIEEICAAERITLHEFATKVEADRTESSLTAGLRVAILAYYRRAAQQLMRDAARAA